MTIEEFYRDVGGDYQEAIGRFSSESILKIFLGKFKEDSSFSSLIQAVDAHDRKASLSAVHALKDVTGNMAFGTLYVMSCVLTEKLHPQDQDADAALIELMKDEYARIILNIDSLR